MLVLCSLMGLCFRVMVILFIRVFMVKLVCGLLKLCMELVIMFVLGWVMVFMWVCWML